MTTGRINQVASYFPTAQPATRSSKTNAPPTTTAVWFGFKRSARDNQTLRNKSMGMSWARQQSYSLRTPALMPRHPHHRLQLLLASSISPLRLDSEVHLNRPRALLREALDPNNDVAPRPVFAQPAPSTPSALRLHATRIN